mgnify:CR=1 FL=1
MLATAQTLTDWRGAFSARIRQLASERTAAAYGQALAAFERYFEQANRQPFSPELLNSWDLRGWRSHTLEAEQLSPATWNLRRAAVKALAAFCQQIGAIANDPSAELAGAEQQTLPPAWLTYAEFGALMRRLEIEINAANTDLRRWRAIRDQAMVMVMAHAGVREGELVALTVADVQLGERAGRLVVRLGKGQKRREIPLNREARRAIGAWLEARAAAEISGAWLFVDERSCPLSTRAVQKRVAALGAAAGVAELTPHRLRHTCAKRMIDAGRALTEVQLILGHARIETTARYTQAGWEDLEEAVESVGYGKARKNDNRGKA